jgi:hypothetical protein
MCNFIRGALACVLAVLAGHLWAAGAPLLAGPPAVASEADVRATLGKDAAEGVLKRATHAKSIRFGQVNWDALRTTTTVISFDGADYVSTERSYCSEITPFFCYWTGMNASGDKLKLMWMIPPPDGVVVPGDVRKHEQVTLTQPMLSGTLIRRDGSASRIDHTKETRVAVITDHAKGEPRHINYKDDTAPLGTPEEAKARYEKEVRDRERDSGKPDRDTKLLQQLNNMTPPPYAGRR